MPRGKKGKHVANGPTGRRGQRSKQRTSYPQQPHRVRQGGYSDDEDGVLRIGGVVLRVDTEGHVLSRHREGGRQQGTQARPKPRPARKQAGDSSDSDSDDSDCAQDAAVRDYLANVAGMGGDGEEDGSREGGDGSDGAAAAGARGMRSRLRQLRKFSGVDLGGIEDSSPSDGSDTSSSSTSSSDSEADTDSGDAFSSGSSSSSSDSDSDVDGAMHEHAGLIYGSFDSEGGASSDREEGAAGAAVDPLGEAPRAGVLTAEELEGLSLEQRFPVQARFRPPPLPGQRQQLKSGGSGKKKPKSAAKGAKGGKLAPGEKAQLRRERIMAKRAARAAGRGFDLAWVNKELQDLVGRRGDMKAFPPMGKHECKAVQRLAALYGVMAGLQGSSKKKFVVATVTERSALPQGEALLQVGHMLAAQLAYELNGTAIMAGPAAAGAAAASKGGGGAGPAGGGGRGRWAGMRGSRGGATRGEAAGGAAVQKAKKKRKHKPPRPVSFISGGAINPDDSVEVVLAAGPMLSPRAPPPDSDAELASPPADLPSQPPPQQQVQELAEHSEEGLGWPGTAGLGSVGASAAPAAGLGFDGAPLAAEVPALGSPPGDEPATAAPAAAAAADNAHVELLEVYEDLSGSESEGEEAAGWGEDGGSHPGLGSRRAMYTRVSSSGLLGSRAGAAQPPAVQGAGPGEGFTNAGRLLGLGLALGVGPQVFGAPLASPPRESDDGLEAVAEVPTADLSPLSPMLSRSQQRKLARQRSRQSHGGTRRAAAGARELEDALPSSSLAAQLRAGGRGKERKNGRSKAAQQRREPQKYQQQQQPDEEEGDVDPAGLVSGDYGYFERHTTGIGSRLLAKWGFGGEGSGLGREGQGRAEPLRASRRAKGLGLGAQR